MFRTMERPHPTRRRLLSTRPRLLPTGQRLAPKGQRPAPTGQRLLPTRRRILEEQLWALHEALDTSKLDIRFPVPGFAGEYYLNEPREHHRWLAAYVRAYRPRRVLELGRRSGNSTYALAYYLDSRAVLDSYDIVDCGNVIDRKNVNIRVYDGDVTALDYSAYDFVFVDINTDGRLEDQVFRSMQRDGYWGLSLWDDIHAGHYPGLRRWWQDLPQDVIRLDITATNHASGTGLIWLD